MSIFLLLPWEVVLAKSDQVVGKLYLKAFMSHLHKEPSRYSASLTTIQCSQAIFVLKNSTNHPGWIKAKVGDQLGYIEAAHLVTNDPNCFQQQYSLFYNSLELDIAQMHHWGKLYDHFLQGKTKPQ